MGNLGSRTGHRLSRSRLRQRLLGVCSLAYAVIAMEDYVAKDERTVKRCLDDVAVCDFYIGIFARRYGYIPPTADNPKIDHGTRISQSTR
jgi:hypothetical protein